MGRSSCFVRSRSGPVTFATALSFSRVEVVAAASARISRAAATRDSWCVPPLGVRGQLVGRAVRLLRCLRGRLRRLVCQTPRLGHLLLGGENVLPGIFLRLVGACLCLAQSRGQLVLELAQLRTLRLDGLLALTRDRLVRTPACFVDVLLDRLVALFLGRDHALLVVLFHLPDLIRQLARTLGLLDRRPLRVTRALDGFTSLRQPRVHPVGAERQPSDGALAGPPAALACSTAVSTPVARLGGFTDRLGQEPGGISAGPPLPSWPSAPTT